MSGRRKTVIFTIDANGCHICTSHAPGTDGYPCVWKDGRNQNLHRVLYEEAHGALGKLLARHTCDVRLCINLAHVIPGTHQDNMDDRSKRGRNNPPVGQRSGCWKLTTVQTARIRHAMGSQVEIARAFGVHQSTISRIKSGERRGIA